MSGRGRFIVMAFMGVVLLSAFGLYQLFALRFESGDMFPPYSSLRSDPLGCKALFMSLERTPGLVVSRNFRNSEKLKGTQGRTIYLLGLSDSLLTASSDKDARELEALAREGNRLIVAFGSGKQRAVETKKQDVDSGGKDEDTNTDDDDTGEETDADEPVPAGAGVWGLATGLYEPQPDKTGERPLAALSAPARELPETVRLHSRRHLQNPKAAWRTIYSYKGQPVVLERTFGSGSIVLLADSYPFSNEAMRNDRSPGLYAWLQGNSSVVLFDESHLGVYDSPGVMTLIKKHHLTPLLLALMALAALYVWKNTVPFAAIVEPLENRRERGIRDSFSGLVNLLRRNIAPGELLTACHREWSKSFSRDIKRFPDLARQLREIMGDEKTKPAGKRDPVALYRKMAGVLSGFRMR